MKLNGISDNPGSSKKRMRIGRGIGSGMGKQGGRGGKGQTARSGVRIKGFEGGQMPMHMRLPKLKGFTNPNRVEFQVVNVAQIEKLFPEGGQIGILDLVKAGAVRKGELVKVLGQGDIKVKIDITANAFSDSAKEKIAAAGGKTTEV